VLVYGNEGPVQGVYRADRSTSDLSREQFVPDALQDLLQSCPHASVLAPPLLNPHPNLLRRSISWSFVSDQHPDLKPGGPVSNGSLLIDTVQRRTVHPILADNGGKTPSLLTSSMLRGLEVTPIHVLAKLRVASRAFLFAQGMLQEGMSSLALTLDPNGEQLTAALVRQQTLAGRPVIFLSRVPLVQHLGDLEEPWSLPSAFIEAGASLVITASQGKDNRALSEAFARIAEALDRGETAAQAVAKERLRAAAHGTEDFGLTITQ
jgi:cellulose synthase operon protein C